MLTLKNPNTKKQYISESKELAGRVIPTIKTAAAIFALLLWLAFCFTLENGIYAEKALISSAIIGMVLLLKRVNLTERKNIKTIEIK